MHRSPKQSAEETRNSTVDYGAFKQLWEANSGQWIVVSTDRSEIIDRLLSENMITRCISSSIGPSVTKVPLIWPVKLENFLGNKEVALQRLIVTNRCRFCTDIVILLLLAPRCADNFANAIDTAPDYWSLFDIWNGNNG